VSCGASVRVAGGAVVVPATRRAIPVLTVKPSEFDHGGVRYGRMVPLRLTRRQRFEINLGIDVDDWPVGMEVTGINEVILKPLCWYFMTKRWGMKQTKQPDGLYNVRRVA